MKKFTEDMYRTLGVRFLFFIAMETPARSVNTGIMDFNEVAYLILQNTRTGRPRVLMSTHGMNIIEITIILSKFLSLSE